MTWIRSSCLAILLLAGPSFVSSCSCESEEAHQLAEAVETFIDFGLSNEERAKAPSSRQKTREKLHQRSRRVQLKSRNGPTIHIVVDLPHELDSKAVESRLSTELEHLLEEEPFPNINVDAMPRGLLKLGGFMGSATARRSETGEVTTKVVAHVRDTSPPLTDAQYDALVDLELAVARAGPGGRSQAKSGMEQRHGREVLREALKRSKRRYGRPIRSR